MDKILEKENPLVIAASAYALCLLFKESIIFIAELPDATKNMGIKFTEYIVFEGGDWYNSICN